MKREEDWLREACGRLAEEEADRLEQELRPADIHQAEAVYRRHRKAALALIRKKGKKRSAAPYLRAAAMVALLIAAVYLSLRQTPPDHVHLASPAPASVAPYFTDAPTPAPTATIAPTATPAPTATIVPTATPAPTASPVPASAPDSVSPPEGWSGVYFPRALPRQAESARLSSDENSQTVVYSLPGGQTLRFTEYASSTVIPVPEGTGVSYAQISDGVIALRLETGQGVTLVWDCAGQTLCLSAADADSAMQIAQSVKKISGE